MAPDPSRLWSGNGYINHSDHKAAGMLALSAVMPDAPSRPMFPELLEEGIEPFEVPNLWLSSKEPDTYVDITDTIDLKLKALEQHVSQGGARPSPWVRIACAGDRRAGRSTTLRRGVQGVPLRRRSSEE